MNGWNNMVFSGQSKKNYEKFMMTPQIIEASWERCRRNRINPALNKMPHISNKLDTKNLLSEAEQFLLSVACSVIRDVLYRNFADEDQLLNGKLKSGQTVDYFLPDLTV